MSNGPPSGTPLRKRKLNIDTKMDPESLTALPRTPQTKMHAPPTKSPWWGSLSPLDPKMSGHGHVNSPKTPALTKFSPARTPKLSPTLGPSPKQETDWEPSPERHPRTTGTDSTGEPSTPPTKTSAEQPGSAGSSKGRKRPHTVYSFASPDRVNGVGIKPISDKGTPHFGRAHDSSATPQIGVHMPRMNGTPSSQHPYVVDGGVNGDEPGSIKRPSFVHRLEFAASDHGILSPPKRRHHEDLKSRLLMGDLASIDTILQHPPPEIRDLETSTTVDMVPDDMVAVKNLLDVSVHSSTIAMGMRNRHDSDDDSGDDDDDDDNHSGLYSRHSASSEEPLPKMSSMATGSSAIPSGMVAGTVRSPAMQKLKKKNGTKSMKPKSKTCNCKKSRCLKLYCECFARSAYCGPDCNCHGCANNAEQEDQRQKAIKATLDRDANAFFRGTVNEAEAEAIAAAKRRGCNCKKSACLKKYCECFQAGIDCTESCKCVGCKNGNPGGGDGHKHSPKAKPGVKMERKNTPPSKMNVDEGDSAGADQEGGPTPSKRRKPTLALGSPTVSILAPLST